MEPAPDLPSAVASEEPKKELFQLHLAEYEALTTRCTYFIALHIGLWAVVVTVVVFVVQEWLRSRNGLLVWLGAAAVQAILHLWVTILEEQYLAVSYIENQLRHSVMRAVDGLAAKSFWRYEAFLSRRRLHENWWGEWIAPAWVGIGVVLIFYWRRAHLPEELPVAIINILLFLILVVRTYHRLKVRRTFASSFN